MRKVLIALAALLCTSHLYAQESAAGWSCATAKNYMASSCATAIPAEDNYDVKYVKLDLALTNQSIYVQGNVTTKAVALNPSFSAYVFELDSALVIDSVLIDGAARPVSSVVDIHTVALAAPMSSGALFTAQVFYHGTPAGSISIFGGVKGITNTTSPSWGTRVTFTQSESYHAREWWPCKQSLHDKIDSADIWITVPDSLKAGSNGTLRAITAVDADHDRYEWHEGHPVDYYLISAAVAPYLDYSYYMHFTGSIDSMLIRNYIYSNPATFTRFKDVVDSIGMTVDYFSQLYSRYPFWDEKYGHSMAPLNGGMENQTMTTIGFFEGWVVAHELGHQWFGDNVTCGTWSDIFCNEGFASYTEDLFREHFYSHADMVSDMQQKQANVKLFDTGSIYVNDTVNENRVFDSRLSYHKGACMLHMLRFIINSDSTFFQVYKTYQQEYKTRTGTIADFNSAAKSVLGASVNGIKLDTFFDQWAYKEGFPKYTVSWNRSGNDVYVRLVQTTALPSSVPFFTLPIEIKLHSGTGDTTIRVINNQPDQLFHFTWTKAMTGVILDPGSWLVYDLLSTTHDAQLAVPGLSTGHLSIYPNPTTNNWTISDLAPGTALILTDLTGRVLLQVNSNDSKVTLSAQDFAAGIYILRSVTADGNTDTYKLIKE